MHHHHPTTGHPSPATVSRRLARWAASACLAGTAMAASAQADLGCEQLAAELKALGVATPAAGGQADAATAAAGAQVLGVLAQQAAARGGLGGGIGAGLGGGLGGMFSGLVGGAVARPAAQGQAVQVAQAVQLLQVAQAVQGGQAGGQAADGAPAMVVQAAALQALAQQRGAGQPGGAQAVQAAGMLGLLGGLMSAAQAQQPVVAPVNPALAELVGSRQEQLGGLFLAKGCKLPG